MGFRCPYWFLYFFGWKKNILQLNEWDFKHEWDDEGKPKDQQQEPTEQDHLIGEQYVPDVRSHWELTLQKQEQ